VTDKPIFSVIPGSGQPSHDTCGELAERVKDLIYEYSGQLPLAAAIGVLAIVQTEILAENNT